MLHKARVFQLLFLQALALPVVGIAIDLAGVVAIVGAVLALLRTDERSLIAVEVVFHRPSHRHQCFVHGAYELVTEILSDRDLPNCATELFHHRIFRETAQRLVDVLPVGAVIILVRLHLARGLDLLRLRIKGHVTAACRVGALDPAMAKERIGILTAGDFDTESFLHALESLRRNDALVLSGVLDTIPNKTAVVEHVFQSTFNRADVIFLDLAGRNEPLGDNALSHVTQRRRGALRAHIKLALHQPHNGRAGVGDNDSAAATFKSLFGLQLFVDVPAWRRTAREPSHLGFRLRRPADLGAEIAAVVLVDRGLNIAIEKLGVGAATVKNLSVDDVMKNDATFASELLVFLGIRQIARFAIVLMKNDVLDVFFESLIEHLAVLFAELKVAGSLNDGHDLNELES